MKKCRTNWHEDAVCALQIELRDYSHLLDFQSEYPLGSNAYRIDLVVIRKLLDEPIPKSLAHIFRTYNIFEIKGIGSTVTTDAYYKANGYALDVSLSFLTYHYPKKLLRHLVKKI